MSKTSTVLAPFKALMSFVLFLSKTILSNLIGLLFRPVSLLVLVVLGVALYYFYFKGNNVFSIFKQSPKKTVKNDVLNPVLNDTMKSVNQLQQEMVNLDAVQDMKQGAYEAGKQWSKSVAVIDTAAEDLFEDIPK